MTTDRERREELVLRLLAAGFYVTLWGVALALTTGVAYFAAAPFEETWSIPNWALGGWCGFSALFLVLAQFDGGPRRRPGRPLTRDEGGPFFDLLDELRAELGLGPITAVRLKPAPVLGVTRVLRPGRVLATHRRAVVIGLPLFRALTRDELRAALAHELAHLARGDVQRGRIVSVAWRRIGLMQNVLGRGGFFLTWLNPVWWYVKAYGAVLRTGAQRIRRRQEARADGLAASIVGAELYARTLVKTAALGVAFRRMSASVVVRGGVDNRPPRNFFSALSVALDALPANARRRLAKTAIREQDETSGDHPPLRLRLESLGVRRALRDDPGLPAATDVVPALEEIEVQMTPMVVRGITLGLGEQVRRRREAEKTAAERAKLEAELEALEQE